VENTNLPYTDSEEYFVLLVSGAPTSATNKGDFTQIGRVDISYVIEIVP